MSDDLTVDLSDVESYGGGFKPLPRNWYKVVVSDWEEVEVKPTAKKFPPGTPGTKWELTVDEGDYENRKLWLTHWHHEISYPFLKNFLQATGRFDESEFKGLNINDAREKAIGATVMVRVVVRPAKGDYDESNEIKSVQAVGSDVGSNSGGSANKLLP